MEKGSTVVLGEQWNTIWEVYVCRQTHSAEKATHKQRTWIINIKQNIDNRHCHHLSLRTIIRHNIHHHHLQS